MVGRTLSHYRVLEQVGTGGAGVVYRAHDERLDRHVALKILSRSWTGPSDTRARLRREAHALSRLNHPNVAAVYDFDQDADVDFLVMEFVGGRPLSAIIPSHGLPEAEVVALGEQLAEGLISAHQQGVIHCDLKPGNIKIDPTGRVKILDFGLARLLETDQLSTHTGTGPQRLRGTLPFMAPEQVRGEPLDVRCDIYAAGAVLYELATGQRLFKQYGSPALLEAILHGELLSPRELNPALSPDLEAVILKALDRDHNRRYQSAKEFGIDLRRLGAGLSVDRRPAPRARSRPLAWLLAAGVIVAVGAGASVIYQPQSPAAPAVAAGGIKLGVLPLRNLTGQARVDDWSMLVQTLLVSDLAGIHDVGVLDPLSVNAVIDHGPDVTRASDVEMLRTLTRAGATLVVHGGIVPSAGGFELQCRLLDPSTGAALFRTSATAASEDALVAAVRHLSDELVAYVQLHVLRVPEDKQLRPWISLRNQNIRAVRAFWQASQYVLRDEQGVSESDLRRAIQLDPEFVAPRIWLVSLLHTHGRTTEAMAQYTELLALEPKSNPFEQTMIGYVGALIRDDPNKRRGYLETALKYSPGNFILLVNLADDRMAVGDCAGALDAMRPAVRMLWPYPPIYAQWGTCAITVGRDDEAREVMESSLAIPTIRPDPGVYALLEALAISRRDTPAATSFAGSYAQRVRELQKTPSLSMLEGAYRELANRIAAAGDRQTAAAILQSGLTKNPDNASFKDALRRVQSGPIRPPGQP